MNDIRMEPEPPRRLHQLDWLRVFATVMLIPFHCLETFGLNIFYVNVANPSYSYEVAANLINLWHMPLFFLISGYSSALALQSSSASRFAISRLKRLAVPLVVGVLVLVPLVGYMSERAEKGIGKASYLEYYPDFFSFNRRDLGGFTGGLSPHHLWFLSYLFAFSMLALLLKCWLKTRSGEHFLAYVSKLLHRWPGLLFLTAIPLAAARATTDFYPSPGYFALIFVIGFLISRDRRLQASLEANFHAALGIVLVATPIVLLTLTRESFEDTLAITFFVFEGNISRIAVELVTISWLIVMWNLASKYLNRSSPVLDYLNTGSIAIYLLHFVAVMVMLHLMLEITTSSFAAFILASCGALIATLAVYEVLVRRFPWVRFLLGIAPQPTIRVGRRTSCESVTTG